MSGDDAYILAMEYVDEILEGGGALKGDDGKSAYQSWLDLGNTGTEEDFINSLKGEKGQVGEKGEKGNNGKSSYEIWLDNGNVGTEQDFLDSLKGDGSDGFSPVITENSNNTDEDYRLDIETKESKFTTPNLKADISRNIAEHNTSPNSHNDIRIFLNELNNRINALANSDDETLDEMKEVVAYIKDNRSLIESITTTKVNVADIIDNLTTNVSNKPLSASQGVVIKNLIDTLQSELTAHANNADIHVTASDKTNWNNATNKINNLEVGGRNLLLNTANDLVINATNEGNNYIYDIIYEGLEKGQTYTFSAEITVEGTEDKRVTILEYNRDTGTDGEKLTIVADGTRQSVTFTMLTDTPELLIYAGIAGSTAGVKATLHNAKLEKGNVATDWTPAPEDKIEIADVNGLQTIADNSQFMTVRLKKKGWYRIASYYTNGSNSPKGTYSNSCELVIKRTYMSTSNEEHRLLLKSVFNDQRFLPISSFSLTNVFTKIRYVYDSTSAYIDVYYNVDVENPCSFLINDGRDYTYRWQTIEPTLVAELTEGETVSTVFDIPANANPVTDLDLTIDAIQGLRAELNELRSLITNS
jgi:hypothetical protein